MDAETILPLICPGARPPAAAAPRWRVSAPGVMQGRSCLVRPLGPAGWLLRSMLLRAHPVAKCCALYRTVVLTGSCRCVSHRRDPLPRLGAPSVLAKVRPPGGRGPPLRPPHRAPRPVADKAVFACRSPLVVFGRFRSIPASRERRWQRRIIPAAWRPCGGRLDRQAGMECDARCAERGALEGPVGLKGTVRPSARTVP